MTCWLCRDNSCSKSTDVKMTTTSQKATVKARKRKIGDLEAKVSCENYSQTVCLSCRRNHALLSLIIGDPDPEQHRRIEERMRSAEDQVVEDGGCSGGAAGQRGQ